MSLFAKGVLFLLCCVACVLGGPPVITLTPHRDPLRPIWVEVNSSFSIDCSVNESSVLVAVYRDNVPLVSTPVGNSGSRVEVVFNQIEFSDAGWYTCTASNEFGRTHLDFLVLVGEQPWSLISTASSGVLRARETTRVELPCHVAGVPVPSVTWTDGFDEIEDDGRFEVDPLTNSLIISALSQSDFGSSFICNASNIFGHTIEVLTVFDVPGNTGSSFQPEPGFPNNPHFEIGSKDTKFLNCVNNNENDIDQSNITFRWTKNFEDIVPAPNPTYKIQIRGDDPTASGYYCCEVHDNQMRLLDTYCITAVVEVRPEFGDNINGPVTVYEGRTVHLLSTATSPSGYDHPTFRWNLVSGEPIQDTVSVISPPPDTSSYSYLIIDTTSGNYPEEDVRTIASNTLTNDNRRRAIQFRVLGNPDNFGENILSPNDWNFVGSGAEMEEHLNEMVFEIEYSGPGDDGPFISQSFDVPEDHYELYVSGRMRYDPNSNVRGAPAIRILVDGVREHDPIQIPFENSSSWQTVEDYFSIPPNTSSVEVQLVVRAMPRDAQVNVELFFSDIRAAFIDDEPPTATTPPGLPITVIVAAGVGAIVGLVLLVALAAIFLCCCCRRGKGSGAKLMRKMTSRYRHSQSFTRAQPKSDMGSARYILDHSHKHGVDEPEPMYEELQRRHHSKVEEEEDEAYYVMPNGARQASSINIDESLYAKADPEESLYARPDPEESLYAKATDSGPPTAPPAIPPRDHLDKAVTQLSDEEDSAYLSILPDTGNEYLQLVSMSKPGQEPAAESPPNSKEDDEEDPYYVVTDGARVDHSDGDSDANYTTLSPRPPSEEEPSYVTASDSRANLLTAPPIPPLDTANLAKAKLRVAPRPVSWAVAPLYNQKTTAAGRQRNSKMVSQSKDSL